jgi:hypothetical protein
MGDKLAGAGPSGHGEEAPPEEDVAERRCEAALHRRRKRL